MKNLTVAVLLFILAACNSYSLNKQVETDRKKPVLKYSPVSEYPTSAAKKGIGGWVKLKFDVNEKGRPVNIVVLDSKPLKTFDKVAKKTLSNWRYLPKVVNGIPVVAQKLETTLTFSLN
ncbi:energy transducer TonB [Shewanella sp. OPT22]|nr:energy transducer TonB [Shewanella sp. OPT22]